MNQRQPAIAAGKRRHARKRCCDAGTISYTNFSQTPFLSLPRPPQNRAFSKLGANATVSHAAIVCKTRAKRRGNERVCYIRSRRGNGSGARGVEP